MALAIRGTAMSNTQIRTLPRRAVRRSLVASSFAALLIILGGVGHALAQDDDDELPDTKFFKSMLRGFGLRNGEENAGINYQERPPLVVPPTRDLPPPQTADAARLNAAWPQDQDEKRRREAAAKRKKEARTFTWDDLSRQLAPSELQNGTGAAKDPALRKRSGETIEEADRQYKPSELGYVGGLFGDMKGFFTGNNKDETATFEHEPARTSLTDPPVGYRSPSPLEPYGVGADKAKPKPMTQEERVTEGTDK
jgi:hypothetical protein